jgi:molybdate transport system ATP-binding protein
MDGPGVEIRLDCGGEALVARLTRYSAERLSLRVGAPVFAIVKSVSFDRSALGAAWRDIHTSGAAAAAQRQP